MTASHRSLGAAPGVGSGHGKEERESQVTFPRLHRGEVVPRSPASSFFIGKISFLQLDQPGTHSFSAVGGVSLSPAPTRGR